MGPSFHRAGYAVMAPGQAAKPIPENNSAACLAEALLGEAWEEMDEEIIKVADVIKTRTAIGYKGSKSICETVHQHAPDGAGIDRCQFSFSCYARRYDYKDWSDALQMARNELARPGVSSPDMVGVTYYYNPKLCRPDWRLEMKEARYVGSHRFMRKRDDPLAQRPDRVLAYIPRPPADIPMHEEEGKAPALMAYAAEEPVKVAKVPLPSERPTQAIEAATADAMATAKVRAVAVLAEALKASAAEQPPPPPSRWDVGELEATNERVLTEMIGLKP
jgi:hypothetical protein